MSRNAQEALLTPVTSESHVPALDGLRGLAILLVMQSHFFGMTANHGFGQGTPSTHSIDTVAAKIFGMGWVGVDLFFVLSGFLITGILVDAKSGAHYFRSFYARRFLRIFPLYYGFLLFVFVFVPQIHWLDEVAGVDGLSRHAWWFWTYTYNLSLSIRDVVHETPLLYGHFWSLAIEEQFYLVWPAVVLLLARRQLMLACGAMFFGSLMLRVFLFNNAPWPLQDGSGLNLTFARTDSLGLGALIALAMRDPRDFAHVVRWAPAIALVSVVSLAGVWWWNGTLDPFYESGQTVGIASLAGLFAAMLVFVLNRPRGVLALFFCNPVLRFFGRYAYGLYVIHLLVAFRLSISLGNLFTVPRYFGHELPSKLLFNLEATSVACVIAFVSWHVYEKQILKLKRFFPYGGKRSAHAPPLPEPTLSSNARPGAAG